MLLIFWRTIFVLFFWASLFGGVFLLLLNRGWSSFIVGLISLVADTCRLCSVAEAVTCALQMSCSDCQVWLQYLSKGIMKLTKSGEEIRPTISHAVTPGWMCMTQPIYSLLIFIGYEELICPFNGGTFCLQISETSWMINMGRRSQAVFAVESMADRRSSLADAWLNKNTGVFGPPHHLVIVSQVFLTSKKSLFWAGLLAAWMLSRQLLLQSAPQSDTTLRSWSTIVPVLPYCTMCFVHILRVSDLNWSSTSQHVSWKKYFL